VRYEECRSAAATRSKYWRLQYYDFATRKSSTIARNLGNVDVGMAATADGRTILYTRVDASIDDLMMVENFR
jgi:hypothetical protein